MISNQTPAEIFEKLQDPGVIKRALAKAKMDEAEWFGVGVTQFSVERCNSPFLFLPEVQAKFSLIHTGEPDFPYRLLTGGPQISIHRLVVAEIEDSTEQRPPT